jgi:hypothetical protein
MKKTFLMLAPMLLLGPLAQAQRYADYRAPLPEIVEQHLDRLCREAYWTPGERHRAADALKHLSNFDYRYREGRFDRGQLDDSIGHVQDVINHNRLNEGQRAMLWRDVEELRAFRATRGRVY